MNETYWSLILLKGQPLIAGTRILLHFSGDKFDGNAGCNGYGGPYDVTNQQAIFQIQLVLCSQPDLMAQEKAYTDIMGKFLPFKPLNYHITSNNSRIQLELLDANGQTVLVYAEVSQEAYNLLSASRYLPTATPGPSITNPAATPPGLQTPAPTPYPSATPQATKVRLGLPIWAGRGQIVDAAFLPDGSGVVVGWGSGVSLYTLEGGREVWSAPGLDPLIKIDVQAQGKAVAAAFADGSLMVINIASGQAQPFSSNEKQPASAGALAWSPDGKTVAYQLTGHDRADPIYLLDVASGQISQVPDSTLASDVTPSLVWSPDGKTISLAGLGATCPRLLDVTSGVERMPLGKPDHCLATQVEGWSPDGKVITVIGASGEVEALGFPDGAVLQRIGNPGQLSAHPSTGQSLFFNPTGRWLANRSGSLATATPFDVITVWDSAHGTIVARSYHPVPSLNSVYRLSAVFDGDSLLMIYNDGTLTRWNFLQGNKERQLFHLPIPAAQAWTLGWSQDGRRLAYTSSLGGVFVWDVANRQAAGQFLGSYDSPALNRDGSLLALSDGTMHEQQVIDLASGKVILRLPAKGIVGGAAFSPDGVFLAYSLGEHAAVVYMATGKSLELVPSAPSIPGPHNRVTHLVWSPDSQALAVATGGGDQENGKVVLWQRDGAGNFQELTRVVDVNANYPMSVVAAFNPSGSRVALESIPNNLANQLEVDVYDLVQHTIIQSAKGYLMGQWVNDGTLLMIEAVGDCRLTRLEVTSGQKTTGNGDCSAGKQYAPGGQDYAQPNTTGTGTDIFDWSLSAPQVVAEHGSSVVDVSWSPGGDWLATVGSDGTVRMWPVTLNY